MKVQYEECYWLNIKRGTSEWAVGCVCSQESDMICSAITKVSNIFCHSWRFLRIKTSSKIWKMDDALLCWPWNSLPWEPVRLRVFVTPLLPNEKKQTGRNGLIGPVHFGQARQRASWPGLKAVRSVRQTRSIWRRYLCDLIWQCISVRLAENQNDILVKYNSSSFCISKFYILKFTTHYWKVRMFVVSDVLPWLKNTWVRDK